MSRTSLSFAAALFCSAAGFAPQSAQAMQQQRQTYNLPAQDLNAALLEVAKIAGAELYASSGDLNGKTSPGLRGEHSLREAVDILLQGSGLTAKVEGRTIIISGKNDASAVGGAAPEPIVVTGSRIAGAPAAAPVIRVTAEDIRNAGQSDLGEVARSLPQNFGGGQNPGVGNTQGAANENVNANGASTFNLRGIGPNATLTLINGNRFAYSSVNSVIDVSAIPIAAVDRVEVVADGASAIYGADAVAGVVNILLKRDYEGFSTSARVGGSTDGGNFQQQINLLGGAKWSSGGLLAAYDYSRGTAIRAKDRSYASANNPDSTLFPAMRRHSILLSGNQRLGAAVTLNADLIYKRGTMKSATGFTVAQPLRASGLEARTRFETFGVAPTLSVDLSAQWKLKASAFFGTDITEGLSQNYTGGAPSTATARHFFNRNLAVEAGLQGPLFNLPAGAARLAIGGGYRTNRFKSEIGTRSFSRLRRNHFAYGELFLPIVSPDQDLAFAHRASLTGALRYEDYSDSGDIVTPKLSFVYDPIEEVRFGVSWGKSFKLPTLYQQYSGYVALLVPVGGFGQGYPAGSTVAYALGPNDRLGPERSENWTFSATVKPVRGVELTASYFRIDYKDRVAPPLASGAGVLDNPIYADLVTFNPSASLLDDIYAGAVGGLQNITGSPYDPARVVAFLDARDRNIARQKYRGFDVAARYDIDLGGERQLSLTAAGTWLDSSQQLLPGLPATDLSGTIFHPPHFRARGDVRAIAPRASFTACDFRKDLSWGICVQEGLNRTPHFVRVVPATGEVRVLAPLSAAHQAIEPLRVTAHQWTNRLGYRSTGFIVWPRDYQKAKRYPAIIITHGSDADERFANPDLQWSYPAQLFAERGYVVLLMNDPSARQNAELWNAHMEWSAGPGALGPAKLRELIWLNGVYSFEDAIAELAREGLVDPDRVGIAGYSRGSQMVNVAMTQSVRFRAASSGDGAYLEPASYAEAKDSYDAIFGGPPLGSHVGAYRRLSPSLRADKVCGPVLQQMASPFAGAIDFYTALREAKVPAQISLYPGETPATDETHLFHIPSNRLRAMRENLAWFDFWLHDRRDTDPSDVDAVARWSAMAAQWQPICPRAELRPTGYQDRG